MPSHRSRRRSARAKRLCAAAPGAALSDCAIRVAASAARPAATRAALLGSVWLGALAVFAPNAAQATDGTWIGGGAPVSNEWTQGNNWSSSPLVPDGVGTATFTNNSAPTSVTISNNAAINVIEFDAAAPAYSFTVQNGANFTINGGTTNSSAALPAFTVNAGAAMTLGDGAFVETGSLAGGGTVTIGPTSSSTLLSVAGSTATTFSGRLAGAGILELDGSALLTLTGLGSTIGGLDICNCDANGLIISGGSLNVTDPSLGTMVEGGTLSVINGGTLQTTNLAVVDSSAMLISGPGSTVTVSPTGLTEISALLGPTSLTIANGGVLTSLGGAAIDSGNPNFTSTVTVTGPGSTWNVGAGLAVGGGGSSRGPGILMISNGGAVNATGIVGVGDSTGTSTLTVTGAGSTLTVLSSLVVGDTSCGCGPLIGTLTVADGGVVNSPGFTGIARGSTLNLGAGGLAGAINTPAIVNDGQIVANFTDTLTLAAAISGAGTLSKAGPGTLVLTANNSYSGATTIDGGTLRVNGSIANSPVTVNAGGTLAGAGTVGPTTINGGGTFAPGNSPGTMTVAGNLAFQSGALYVVQVTPSTASSTNVTGAGSATLAGTVQAVFAPGSYVTHTYTILSAAGGRIGTFNALTTSNLPANFTPSLSYTATGVILNLTAALGALTPLGVPNAASGSGSGSGSGASACAFSINQCNVAGAINAFFNNGGALPGAFANLFGLTGVNLGNALTLLSGEAATGAQQAAFQLTNQFLGIMLDPFVDGRSGVAGTGGPALGFAPGREELPEDIALAYAKLLKAPPAPSPASGGGLGWGQRWTVWGAGYGGGNRTSGDPAVVGSHDLSARTAGGAAGLDYHLTRDSVVGVALAGGGTNWSLAQGLGGGKSDAFQAGLYGTTRWGAAYVAAALAFTNHWMSTDRFAFAGDHLSASFNAQSFGGRVESGYRIATIYGGLTPYAAIQAQNFRTPTYSEADLTAGGFALGYNSRSASDTRSELGGRFDRLLLLNPEAALTLRARVAWAHDWVSDPTLAAVFQALPGASFLVNGATPAKNSALTSAGAELRLANGVSLLAKFDGEFASHSSTYAGTGTVRYAW
jgi:autotransporter-associated beta strand protein/T5SS/PEP-CTERM-associated repeat protein